MVNKVVNFPTTDQRVTDFAEELHDFICQKAENLSLPSIIGALEIVKHAMLYAATSE